MVLPIRVGGDPAPREGIKVQPLRFLAAVAAALPGKHRAVIASLPRRPARLIEPAVAVAQQGASQNRLAQVEEGKDEQFVPHDVSAVGLAVPSARGYPDI